MLLKLKKFFFLDMVFDTRFLYISNILIAFFSSHIEKRACKGGIGRCLGSRREPIPLQARSNSFFLVTLTKSPNPHYNAYIPKPDLSRTF